MNKYEKQMNKNSQTPIMVWWLVEKAGVGGEKGKGGQTCGYRSRSNFGSGHKIQYTDNALQNCMSEIYIILLTNVTPINLIYETDREKETR